MGFYGCSVPFPFISSTFAIISRCFSTIVSSLLFRYLLSCCSQLISLFESVSAFSTCLCWSSILVRARLRGNTICTPSFSLSTSSHLHQIKPPHVSQPATIKPRPPSRSAPVLQCQTARTQQFERSSPKACAFVRVAVNRFLEISDVGVSTAASHPSPKAFVWTPLSDQTQTRAPLSLLVPTRVTLSSGLPTRPVGPLSCQTLGGTGTYCHRPPTLHLDRPTSVQRSS